MSPKFLHLLLLLPLMLLTACSGDPDTGPKEVRFDRDACERCRMVVSDPHFAAEVRYFPKDGRSQVAKFDDIGCAVIWLKDKPWKDNEKTEIWVADHRTGKWINAKTATYVSKKTTPMEYGLGAQNEATTDGVNFAEAKQHIDEIENRYNSHGLHSH